MNMIKPKLKARAKPKARANNNRVSKRRGGGVRVAPSGIPEQQPPPQSSRFVDLKKFLSKSVAKLRTMPSTMSSTMPSTMPSTMSSTNSNKVHPIINVGGVFFLSSKNKVAPQPRQQTQTRTPSPPRRQTAPQPRQQTQTQRTPSPPRPKHKPNILAAILSNRNQVVPSGQRFGPKGTGRGHS
jgi:hypothetical protein